MKLNRNRILYLSLHDIEKDLGVENKIRGICSVAHNKGFEVERITRYCRTIKERRSVMVSALKSDAGIFIIRSFGTLTIAVYDQLYKAKKEGRILICDQPSPLSTTLNEIWHSPRNIVKRIYGILWGVISGPWAMYQYDRIVEYAPEGYFYTFGNKSRIKLLGNGIDVNRIKFRSHIKNSENSIRLLGVANTSVHHGFDRIIKAIAMAKAKTTQRFEFDIIGGDMNSAVIIALKELARNLQVENLIHFLGFKPKEFIAEAYNNSDLAIGSLGLFRIGLNVSSILKVREYCLAGIPFIAAGKDPDFPQNVPFRFVVPNDESIEPIVRVLLSFPEKRKTFTDETIRKYAIEHFSFDKKFEQIMEGLI